MLLFNLLTACRDVAVVVVVVDVVEVVADGGALPVIDWFDLQIDWLIWFWLEENFYVLLGKHSQK